MSDNISQPTLLRYEKLRRNVKTLFDLQWLREETASLLMQQFSAEITSPWQAMHQWDLLRRTDHLAFFAYQLLTTYPTARDQVATFAHTEMPMEMLEEEMSDLLWLFSKHNASKSWIFVTPNEDAAVRTKKWHLSAQTIYNKCRQDDQLQDFFLLFNSISILNDVMHGKARLHGLQYSKKSTQQSQDPVEVFCQRLTDIVDAAAQLNGQTIASKAKGKDDSYTFHINAKAFSSMIQELKANYTYLLEDYLGDRDATQVCQLNLVCPFLGFVIDTKLITGTSVQKKDLEPVLKQFYPENKSFITKLSLKPDDYAALSLFRVVENLLRERNKE